jgi:hypothetical protein
MSTASTSTMTMSTVDTVFTVGGVAKRFGVAPWRVRRLFERGLLPPPSRLGLNRVVNGSDLPKIETALRDAGYLRSADDIAAVDVSPATAGVAV